MRKKELFYYVTRGSNVTRDVYWCVTVDYRQIANDNIANQILKENVNYCLLNFIVSLAFWKPLEPKKETTELR